MDGSVEEAFAATFGGLAIARMLFAVGHQARIEEALPIVGRITAASQVERGASEVSPHLFGHPLQRFQPRWEQNHVGLVNGCDGHRSSPVAVVVGDGTNLFSRLM